MFLTLAKILRDIYCRDYRTLPGLLGKPGELIEDRFVDLSIQEDVQAYNHYLFPPFIFRNHFLQWHHLFQLNRLEEMPRNILSILLVGEAGMGKSSLSHYLAYQWAKKPDEKEIPAVSAWRKQF